MDGEKSDTELDYESDVDLDADVDELNADTGSDSNEATAVEPGPLERPAETDGWKTEGEDIVMQDFGEQPGPRHTLGTTAVPLDYFFLMFPLALIKIFVEQTNLYASQCIETKPNASWYDTDLEEMRAFLAMQIMFGIKSLPRLWMYWSEDPRFNDPWISKIMPITRFKNLSRYFHVRDTSAAPRRDQPDFDPLFKIRNVITATQQTFAQHFQANAELSVDECMVGFKGRLYFKQYMPAKPTKWGIKIWTICDARLGYCLGYDIYTGKASRRNPGKPLGFEVVDTLCSPHYGKGHHIYMDRFFNSVEIASHLLANNTYMCGTIMSNRKGLPPAIKKKLKTRGDVLQLQKGNIVATAYHDKRTITLLSTNQVVGVLDSGRPRVLDDYNKFMGGVDNFDQHLSYYSVGRPGKKWWRYLIWHLIGSSIYNAYVTWRHSTKDYDIGKSYDHLLFQSDVAEGLLNGYTSRKLPGRRATKQVAVAPETIKHHVLIKIDGRKKQCVLCIMNKVKTPKGYPVETSFMCKFCKVPLCKKLCFAKYHELAMTISDSSR